MESAEAPLSRQLDLPSEGARGTCRLATMTRSPAHSLLRAFVALLVTLLQVVGALHFALVPHAYSASLGGVVHVHAAAPRAQTPNTRAHRSAAPALSTDTLSCIADRCPVADAPHSAAPDLELQATGYVAFGDVRLLSERGTHATLSLRLFLNAPKTSPPV